jgi:hypothetical protein
MKTIRIILSFGIPLISIFFGLIRYFFIVESKDAPGTLVMITFSLIVIPLLSVMINLWIYKFLFDSNIDGLKSTNENLKNNSNQIQKVNRTFIEDIDLKISESISRSSNYFTILSSEHKEQIIPFILHIIGDFNLKINELSLGHLFENDPTEYQSFVASVFNLAKKTVKATSIVDPKGFWDEDVNTINYLRDNKRIIDSGIQIERYFFINDNNKESSKKAIGNNLIIGVETYLILEDEIKPEYIKDIGTIDDYIAIVSDVDSNSNIYKVDIYIGDKKRYIVNNNLFDLYKSKRKTIKEE